jgi:multidrug efflux system membrane fusion protein
MNWSKTLPVAGVVVAIGVGVWLYFGGSAAPQEKKGPPAVPVLMAKAEIRDVALTLELAGRTEAYETVSLKARVDGQVLAVPFTEGRHVGRGEVLVRLDPRDFEARLRQAEANLARDQAQVIKAQADVERAVALKAKNFVAEAAVETARAAADSAAATVKADRAAADLARLQLDYATVSAPFDGVVGARLVFPGSSVIANNTALAVVNRVRPLLVRFDVPEKYLPRLRAGMAKGKYAGAAISLPGGDKSAAVTGEVRFLDNAVDPTTGTIQMKALLANEDEKLTPGQFVNISLALETLSQVVTVPTEAVQQGPEGTFLYVVAADETVQVRKVAIAATQGAQGKQVAAVKEGLAGGEIVVTDGQLRLVPGAKVRPADTRPAEAPPAGVKPKQ